MAEMPGTNSAPHHHGSSVQFLEKLGSRFYQQTDGNRVRLFIADLFPDFQVLPTS